MYVTGVNMATAEELDKQVSATSDGKTMAHHSEVNRIYKSEHVLSDTASSMAIRVRALIETWNELAVLHPQPSRDSLYKLAKFLLSHTLNIVLSVKWMKYKNDCHSLLEQAIKDSMKKHAAFLEFQTVCTKLLSLIKGPWSKSQIKEMLTMETSSPTRKEYNFFVFEESAYIISMRLKKLCEDKCGDMALNLTRCYLKCCDWAEEERLSMYISDNQKKFVFDIYLSLLYQHDGIVEMSNLLKTMEISNGVDMVRRFAGKMSSKLWENNISIGKLSGTIFLTRCVMQPFDESSAHLQELLAIWTLIFVNDKDSDELIASLRRIMKNAHTAAHMYLFVDHLSSRFGLKMRPYCVEVCIQAINTDLNLLERVKSERDEHATRRADELSLRIADGFMRLAHQFADNLHVRRECVLTSFSIKPTAACFLRIEEVARASGYEVLDTGQWKCKLHAPPDPDEELLIQCDACKDYVGELKINPALKQASTALLEAFKVNNMGLPSVLCDDLVVIIYCVRYQMLSWQQRWQDLQRLCVMYLNDPVGTKNLITELKFVEIDYTPFMIKQEVEEYEEEGDVIDMEIEAMRHTRKRRRVLSSSSEEESGVAEGGCDVPSLAAALNKSDPNVLKALKSFRRFIRMPPSEYEFDSSPHRAHTTTLHSSLSGTNSNSIIKQEAEEEIRTSKNDAAATDEPKEEKHRQEFGNFRHDAENYEIDRELSDIKWDKKAPDAPDFDRTQSAAPSDTYDTLDNELDKNASQNLLDLLKKVYNIKECSVVLTRCDAVDAAGSNIRKVLRPRGDAKCRSKAKLHADNKVKSKRKSSENVVQSQLVKYYKINLKYPLQINNRRILSTNNNVEQLEALKRRLLGKPDKMNPVVVLKRLEESCVQSLLARVPGVHDTDLFRPIHTDQIVNVVQVAGGRSTATVQAPSTQTSTQVSPHIQRIGQPRSEKADADPAAATTTYTISKPSAGAQSSTLINILSQQIIRPQPTSNIGRSISRSSGGGGPLINIISQPTMIRSTSSAAVTRAVTTVTSAPSQINATTRIIATSSEQQQQIINQIVSTSNRAGGSVKAVVDGKLIPVTSFPSNRLLKVATTTASQALVTPPTDPNSNTADDSFTKAKTEASEIAETLPKFQQAFGKSVYQQNTAGAGITTNPTTNTGADGSADKTKAMQITQIKNAVTATTVCVQPIQGSVIYTRQMPVGQTINLIQQNRGQVFRIATTTADSAIHSKMSALLAAALQGKPKTVAESSPADEGSLENGPSTARLQIARPTLVQSARVVKPVQSNVIRTTPPAILSSTTLEQLREFDMVYKQVKERSSTSTPADASSDTDASPQRISVTYLNQTQKLNCTPVVVVGSLQPAASSPALSVASQGSSSPCVTPAPPTATTPVLPSRPAASKTEKKGGKTVKNPPPMHAAAKTSPIPKPQQKPQEDEHTTQRIFDILAEYAEQLRNSPDLNNKPAPRRRSNPPTNPSQSSKRKKSSSSSKKSGQCSSLSTDADLDDPRTLGSEDSSCGGGLVQLSMQDDEHTPPTTSESNDSSTNHVAPRQQQPQQLILTDSNQTRNLIITSGDTSVGEALNTAVLVPGNYIMPVSMVKGGQQIAVVSGGSKILATVPARSGPNMLLFQSFLNQNRKTNIPSVKYSTIAGISSHSLAGVSAQPPVILPPPAHAQLVQPITLQKLDDSSEQLLLTISRDHHNGHNDDPPQPDSSTSVVVGKPIAMPVIAQAVKQEEEEEEKAAGQTTAIITLDINSQFTKGSNNLSMFSRARDANVLGTLAVETPKSEERVQSVLVSAGTSNGPMLSHSPPQYNKQSDCSNGNEPTKDEFLRNERKERNDKVQSTVFCVQGGKIKKSISNSGGVGRMDREVQQMCMQRRQAAIERELRLQKSLSEECEDLGVDEPSASDLFPEALLFDANNSPSFDQTSQDTLKRSLAATTQHKDDHHHHKLSLFSDDDFIFEAGQYDDETNEDNQLCYEEVVDARNGDQGKGGAAGEDSTLLQTCTSMSDVTLSSPVSPPDTYHANTPPPLNKYMHKYTNKKKACSKPVDTWSAEVSSSEDTMGSSSECAGKRGGSDEEEISGDGAFQLVRIALGKNECNDMHCLAEDADVELDCSASGRGARKPIKKTCSCCNGAEDGGDAIQLSAPPLATSLNAHAGRKRPASGAHQKAFPSKKR